MMTILWQGTVDNLELSGIPAGDRQPMRIVESEDGRLMTEYASAEETAAGIVYDERCWFSEYQIRFRDMDPRPSAELRERLLAQNLIDA